MEKLNEYLQTLLSTFSYELHLEPNKNPYIVSENGSIDVASAPMLGTQISTLIFPLIPTDVKMQLPNKQEIEFVHHHNLGDFNFQVKKSPAGFIVTIRPALNGQTPQMPTHEGKPSNTAPKGLGLYPIQPETVEINPITVFNNSVSEQPAPQFSLESSSHVFETETRGAEISISAPLEIEIEEVTGYADNSYQIPRVETVPVNSPEFVTTFSDDSTYEPPAKRNDFLPANSEYVPPTNDFSSGYYPQNDGVYNSVNHLQEPETYPQTQNYQPVQTFQTPPQEPAQAAFVPAAANPSMKARMDAMFQQMAQIGASDLHLSVSMPPMVRKDGRMQPLASNEQMLSPEVMKQLLTSIMPAKNQEEFARRSDSDFAYEIQGLARFRANIFMDRKGTRTFAGNYESLRIVERFGCRNGTDGKRKIHDALRDG
jgi:hypothetical protein